MVAWTNDDRPLSGRTVPTSIVARSRVLVPGHEPTRRIGWQRWHWRQRGHREGRYGQRDGGHWHMGGTGHGEARVTRGVGSREHDPRGLWWHIGLGSCLLVHPCGDPEHADPSDDQRPQV